LNKVEFETRLGEVYNGAIKPVTTYINDRATMYFKCEKCGVEFFGKASHMVGKEHQQHKCNYPYGDIRGERLKGVGSRHNHKRNRNNKIDGAKLVAKLDKLLKEGCPYWEIRKQTGVDIQIIKCYAERFHKEERG
jgi:hypothetical protein